MISQPAVTQSIKMLEGQLGVTLFVRTKKGVILTDEGEELYKYVKEGMTYFINGYNTVSSLKNLNSGVLKIGASTSITENYLMSSITKFHELYPNVEIKIIVDETLKKEPKSQIDELEKAGINIKTENWRGKMHQKSMVVDDFITVVASTNWTGASEYSNDENMLVIKNKTIANVQEKEFLRLWKSIK